MERQGYFTFRDFIQSDTRIRLNGNVEIVCPIKLTPHGESWFVELLSVPMSFEDDLRKGAEINDNVLETSIDGLSRRIVELYKEFILDAAGFCPKKIYDRLFEPRDTE